MRDSPSNKVAMKKKMTPQELENFVSGAVRGLPNRRAPGTLEARVLAALEHREHIAWWHKSWAYWPTAVRAAFLAFATAVSGTMVAAVYAAAAGWDTGAVASQFASHFSGLSRVFGAGVWIIEFCNHLIGSVPSLWIYGGLAFAATLYVSLFGLGAVAYRTLYRSE